MSLVRLDNEKALLQKIADGDPVAFGRLYHAFAPSLFKAIMAYAKDVHLAEDVLQMVFIKIWEKRQMATELESVEDFLFILVRNLVLTWWKQNAVAQKAKQTLTRTIPITDNDPEAHLHKKEYSEIYRKAVDRLPPRQRQVYILATHKDWWLLPDQQQSKSYPPKFKSFVNSYLQP